MGRAVSDIFNKWTAGGDTTPSTDEAHLGSQKSRITAGLASGQMRIERSTCEVMQGLCAE